MIKAAQWLLILLVAMGSIYDQFLDCGRELPRLMDSFPTGSAAFSNQPVSKVTNESENSANVTTPTLNQLLVNSGQKYHSGFGSSEAMQEEDNQHAMSSRFPQRPPVPNQGIFSVLFGE